MTALNLGEAGTRRQPTVAWRYRQNVSYIPTPIVYKDIVYMIKEGGILSAIDLATGRLLKRGRVHTSAGEIYASPIVADGKLFLATLDGKVIVIQPGSEWKTSRSMNWARIFTRHLRSLMGACWCEPVKPSTALGHPATEILSHLPAEGAFL